MCVPCTYNSTNNAPLHTHFDQVLRQISFMILIMCILIEVSFQLHFILLFLNKNCQDNDRLTEIAKTFTIFYFHYCIISAILFTRSFENSYVTSSHPNATEWLLLCSHSLTLVPDLPFCSEVTGVQLPFTTRRWK